MSKSTTDQRCIVFVWIIRIKHQASINTGSAKPSQVKTKLSTSTGQKLSIDYDLQVIVFLWLFVFLLLDDAPLAFIIVASAWPCGRRWTDFNCFWL